MRKKTAILIGFSVLGLLDSVLSYGLPLNFQYTGFSILWHWYLIGLLVFVRDKPILLRFLISSLAAIAYGMLFGSRSLFIWVSFVGLAVLIGFFQNWMNNHTRQFLVYLLMVTVFDLFSYLWMRSAGAIGVSFFFWLYRMEAVTIFVSAICIVTVMFADNVMVRFFLIQRHLERKHEKKLLAKMQAQKATEYL